MSNLCEPRMLSAQLDALDRVLLGLLPREERLAIVSQVESRILELGTTNADAEVDSNASIASSLQPVLSNSATQRRVKRSRLALSSGVLGIVAMGLLIALPICYFLVAMLSDVLDGLSVIFLIGIHTYAIGIFGAAALVFGLLSLWRLGMRRNMTGKAWAITGVCTGPLPMLAGGVATILLIAPLRESMNDPVPTISPALQMTSTGYLPENQTFTFVPSGSPVPATVVSAADNVIVPSGIVCPHCNQRVRGNLPMTSLPSVPYVSDSPSSTDSN